jgi:hypothetical protein
MSGPPAAGTNDDLMRPPLRYRRLGGGYRREDVERLLAEVQLTVHALEVELGTLRHRAGELEQRLRSARAELDGFQARSFEHMRALDEAREHAASIDDDARRRAAELVAVAERRVEQLHYERDRLVAAIYSLIGRVGASVGEPTAPVEDASADAAPTRVELDAGPFADLDSVFGFERDLASLADVDDVYVRTISGDRATIELTTAQAGLLDVLIRAQLPYSADVRERSSGRLVIDVQAIETGSRASTG